MRVVRVRNVSEAWARLGETLQGAQREPSRAGEVLAVGEPVTTVYERPTERVLFCPARNASPFFHLMEALWMLTGRADGKFLDRYVKDFSTRFAEPSGAIHGAYGHRWRHAMGVDQLEIVVQKLRASPRDRQAVIQMWDEGTWNDLTGTWRDRPCNTHVYLRVRKAARQAGDHSFLDLTVLCRSNDMIFGGYGANAVHFSVLQEYLAARIGVEVGMLYQVSSNFHVYVDVWEKMRPSDEQVNAAESVTLGCSAMFTEPDWIDQDLRNFMDWHTALWIGGPEHRYSYHNPWFAGTAQRVARAWYSYRAVRSIDAAEAGARAIECPAWRTACLEWLQRRST